MATIEFQSITLMMAGRRRMIPILLWMTVPFFLGTVVRLIQFHSSTHADDYDNDSPSRSRVSSLSRQVSKRSGEGGGENDMFEMMHQHLYDIAHQSSSNNENEAAAGTNNDKERKKYTLDAVPKSGGGLLDDDRELLGRLYHDANSVFEFGVGESTLIAAHVGVPRYSGVDSDANWIAKARESVLPHNMSQYRFTFADIGPTKMFGRAIQTNVSKIPLSYQSTPLYSEMEAFDVYLVDGRYRVACACSSMLHAISRHANMSTVLFGVHDWSTPMTFNRDYDKLLAIGTIVHKSTKLAVLQVRSNVTAIDIAQIWEENIWSTW